MAEGIHQFPQGFLWGCATASHQVEGQNTNDWWQWEQTDGRIFGNHKAGLACDWWSGRYSEDFDRASDMRNNAHRLSIEWSRIEPEPGKWDDYAIGRYRDMLKGLIDRGMKPLVTLHHITNPLWVGHKDGWLWDEAPAHFERFVRKVVSTMGDLCDNWCTFNEPNAYASNAFALGRFPPGISKGGSLNKVIVNILRGHVAAYHTIKELQPHSQVGFTLHHLAVLPGFPRLVNSLAAHIIDLYFNRSLVLAIVDGNARLPIGRKKPIPGLKGALDWIGLQYYQAFEVGFSPLRAASLFIEERKPRGMPAGPGGWGGIAPDGVFPAIVGLWKTLKKPIIISESGIPDPDDLIRPGYLIQSVRSVWRAV